MLGKGLTHTILLWASEEESGQSEVAYRAYRPTGPTDHDMLRPVSSWFDSGYVGGTQHSLLPVVRVMRARIKKFEPPWPESH